MKKVIAKITDNKRIAPRFYRMRLLSAYLARNTKPGQFLEVKCSDSGEHILRRPLSVHRVNTDSIELLYEVVGAGTMSLSTKKAGNCLDVIGPLGIGFVYRISSIVVRKAILVAGGIGVAPLVVLAEDLRRHKYEVTVIIGAKTKSHILCESEFRKMRCSTAVSTEDGSKGRKGLVTDLLRNTINDKRTTIFACGPHPMLKAVAHIARLMDVPCQVSMEEKMACGVGVCLGCPVKIKGRGYKMVCKDGPVFDAKEIAW